MLISGINLGQGFLEFMLKSMLKQCQLKLYLDYSVLDVIWHLDKIKGIFKNKTQYN